VKMRGRHSVPIDVKTMKNLSLKESHTVFDNEKW
jgi:hypothetical protein